MPNIKHQPNGNWRDKLNSVAMNIGIVEDPTAPRPMGRGETYCLRCKDAMPIAPQIHTPNPNGTLTVRGRCPKGHKVSRFMSRTDFSRLMGDLNRVTGSERSARAVGTRSRSSRRGHRRAATTS